MRLIVVAAFIAVMVAFGRFVSWGVHEFGLTFFLPLMSAIFFVAYRLDQRTTGDR